MSTGEDEPLPVLNGRLRPRKSTSTTPSPQSLTIRKTEGKLAQDKPKRTSGQTKASPIQKNDLATKSDTLPTPLFLCPYCDRTFATRQTASKHARRIHLSTSKQDNFINCLYCNNSDAESHAIIKHMVDSHPNQYFACLDCHTRFHSTTELAEHKHNVCEKQKLPYRHKLRQKTSAATKKNPKRLNADEKSDSPNENTHYTDDRVFNGIVISCELKPSEVHDATDIEDKITTNLILPPSKSLASATMEKNAVIVLDDLQWNKRIPPNFSFHNTDADQILSRLGVVHRSPRVGESRKDLIRMMDEPNEKFEKCFDTSFYSKVAKNVQDNIGKYLDGSFNFNPDKDNTIKTRKSKMSVVINTAEGFPILLAHEQFSRNLFDGFIPRTMTPKHKWKWDTTESDKNAVMLLDQKKRDSHVNNCIITLVSSLDIWTQLRMRRKFEEIFKTTPTAKKTVKQNIISMELKEILESRDIPTTSTQVVQYRENQVVAKEGSELPAYLGLSPTMDKCGLQPAVLSGEWVRPRCYVCCACGEQTCDARALSAHITSQHPNAQVQHYEIVGETLLSADILKHLYVPPSQISNRTRPPRGFRDCTKCKKSITLEDLHQHMLDCAGDTPTVRRKCRYRPFGVRRRRPRLPVNTIRKKIRKDIRSRHRQKGHMRPRIRTEVGDAETIRKMIADLPAKRNRITPSNVLRPRRNIIKVKKSAKLRASEDTKANKARAAKTLLKPKKTDESKKQHDTDNSVDEDDQPLKLSAKRVPTRRRSEPKDGTPNRGAVNNRKKKKQQKKIDTNMEKFNPDYHKIQLNQINPHMLHPNMLNANILPHNMVPSDMYPTYHCSTADNPSHLYRHQRRNSLPMEQLRLSRSALEHYDKFVTEQAQRQDEVSMQSYQLAREQAIQNIQVREQEQQQHHLAKQQANCKTTKIRMQRNLRARELYRRKKLAQKHALENQIATEHDPLAYQLPKNQGECNWLANEQTEHIELAEEHELVANQREYQFANEKAEHQLRLVNEQAEHIQLAKEHESLADQREYQLAKGQEVHSWLAQEQAKHIQLAEELRQHVQLINETEQQNQMTYEIEQHNQLTQEYEKYNQLTKKQRQHDLTIDQSHHRIDLRDAGPCNIRRHSNRDDYNMQNGKNRSAERGDDSNRNYNMTPASDVPLKHSIASLTTETAPRNASLPYKHANLLPQEINMTIKHTTEDNRQKFENEALPQKLHKPPLLHYPTQLQEADVEPPLLNDTRQLGGDPPLSNDSLKPVEPSEEQTEMKIETDKSKLNKTRKGLNDCIAMLRTKKGLRLNHATSECGDDENLEATDTEIVGSGTVEPQSDTNGRKHSKTKPYSTPGLIDENSINLTPAQVFSRSVLPGNYQIESYSEAGIQRDSIVDLSIQTASADGEIASLSLTKKTDKREFNRTRSSSETEHKTACQMTHPTWVESSQSNDNNPGQILQNMRHNSYDGVPIPGDAERFLKIRQSETVYSLNQIQNESKTKTIGCTDGDLQERYSKHFTSEIFNQQSNASLIRKEEEAYALNKLEPTWDVKKSLSSRRTRRKPSKKDQISFKPQSSFNYRRSPHKTTTHDDRSAVSPLTHDSCRNFGLGVEDLNVQLLNARYLTAPSSSIQICPVKSPPVPRLPREPYKRSLHSSETVASIASNHDDGSQIKIIKKSMERNSDNKLDIRRHSIELATVQSNIASYDNSLLQARSDRWDKEILKITPSSGGPSQWHKTISEEFLKRLHGNNVRCETSNELLSRYSSLTFETLNQDTRGILYINPETERNDILNKTKNTQDNCKNLLENQRLRHNSQFQSAQKEKSIINLESNADCMSKDDDSIENKNTNQEFHTDTQMSYVQDNTTESHRDGVRRCSGEYFTRSSPYQRNFLDEENRNSHDDSLHRAYHKASHVAYARPAVPYSDNIYREMPIMPSLHCEDEDTPLDLSCDSKIRKEKDFDSCKKSSDVFKKPCDIPIKKIKDAVDSPAGGTTCHNFTEQLQNEPPNPSFSCYKTTEDKPNEEHFSLPGTDAPLNETEENRIHHVTNVPKNLLDHGLRLSTISVSHSEVSTLSEDSFYNPSQKNISNNKLYITSKMQDNGRSRTSEDLLSQHPECNLHIPQESQSSNSTITSHESMLHIPQQSQSSNSTITSHESMLHIPQQSQSSNSTITSQESILHIPQQSQSSNSTITSHESKEDMSLCENKNKIARFSSTQVNHNIPERRSSWIDGDLVNPVVENVDSHANFTIDHHVTPVNITTKNENEMNYQNTDTKTVETTTHSNFCNQDVLLENDEPMDQDPDTARKIAMLPKELVEILGTMPKDHRNQLLNILPQYVSTSVSTTGKEMANTSSVTVVDKTSDKSEIENRQHNTACGNINKLIINTAISPSRIIPKKRHSPSHTTVKLNFSEAQQTVPVLHSSNMPIMSQLHQTVHEHMAVDKLNSIQSPHKNNDSDSCIKDPLTGATAHKSLDKDSDDTEINVVDWCDQENTNKSEDVPKLDGRVIFTSFPQDTVTPRPITKSKNSNEQTASLRAVRIKPTSARKSFSEEKNISTNAITYQTNLSTDEKYVNTEQTSATPMHYNYRNITDCKLDKSKQNPEIKIDYNSDMLLRPPLSDQNSTEDNDVLYENKAIESPTTYKMRGTYQNETSVILIPAIVSQNEDVLHNSRQNAIRSNKTDTLKQPNSAMQGINKEQDHFLGLVKSTTFSGGGNHKDARSVQQSNLDASLNNNKEVSLKNTQPSVKDIGENEKDVSLKNTQPSVKNIDGYDFTTLPKAVSELETIEKNSEIATINDQSSEKDQFSKISEVKETISPDLSQHQELQLNFNKGASLGETLAHILSSEHINEGTTKSNCKPLSVELSPEDEKNYEDDSEDEVSLAVLKQKHSSHTIFPKQSRITAKLGNEEKKHQAKLARRCRKKRKPESSKTVANEKLFEDCINIDNVKDSSDIELSFNDTDVKGDQNKLIPKSISVDTIELDKDKIKNHYEFDVNKENNVTENVNKIKEDDNILLPENNPIESQLDNTMDKNIDDELKDAPNFNLNLDPAPEISAIEEINNLTAVEVSFDHEIKEKRDSVRGSLLKQKRKNKTSKSLNCVDKNLISKNTVECGSASDISSKNDLNILITDTIETLETNLSHVKPKGSKLNKLPIVSTKLTTFTTSQDSVESSLQLCAEIPELNNVPLRRSRRGKSMYVDSNCSEDAVEVEDIDQKTPLTMKHLILSRVEKEKERVNEHTIFEKGCDADDIDVTKSEVTDASRTKKRKQSQRKTSPQSRRKSKKSKPLSSYQSDGDTSDISNVHSASVSNSSILRERPKTKLEIENKTENIASCKDDVKNHDITEINTSLISTLDFEEKINEESGDCMTGLQESNNVEKRKLNITEITDSTSSKPKKVKYTYKEKISSDIECEDEKQLLEPKQKILNEKHLILDDDSANAKLTKTLNKEDGDDQLFKICNEVNTESKMETNKGNIVVESRTTCYNRPISSRRYRSSSDSFKDNANYDPYNIDFEDMLEPTRPIIKKRVKNVGNSHGNTANVQYHKKICLTGEKTKSMDVNSSPLNIIKESANAGSNINNESDSDSSKSDVPLQKYVEEKALETEIRNKKRKSRNNSTDHAGKREEKVFKQKSDGTQQNPDNSANSGHNEDKTSNVDSNVEIPRSSKGKKCTKRGNKYHSSIKDETANFEHNLNMSNDTSIEQTAQKQESKEKKTRRTLATPVNDDSICVSKEEDLQLKSDKFMENFGFYSERIPRKSNLLATKKIAETYSMISNESDDNYFRYKEKPIKKTTLNENKKRFEISNDVSASQDPRDDESNLRIQPTESKINVAETFLPNEPIPADDGDVDSLTAQNIMDSEEIRNLENALFSGFKEAADANAAPNCYLNFQPTNNIETIRQDISILQIEEHCPKIDEHPETTKKPSKSKPNIQTGVKDKMYPDIEEIDMFEDKFDKIKRKRRSQAVAAKQVKNVVENNTSVKSRKRTERKRRMKNTKKNYQSTQVPTKGALKGFDGIKISIPTQDLNMPPNVSPPRQQKKRRKAASKRRKERTDSESICSEYEDKDKSVSERDIYEFKDNEDAELFDLRPSTVMDRFRSMHVKNKFKHKEKDKGKGDVEKERLKEKTREKERKIEAKEKELVNDERQKSKERVDTEFEKRQKKYAMREAGRCIEKNKRYELSYSETKLDAKEKFYKLDENINLTSKIAKIIGPGMNQESTRNGNGTSSGLEKTRSRDDDLTENADNAVPGTSGHELNRIDESDDESELSSPEGEFIFYMSNDINCVCPSDNDSDDSDAEKSCGRPNCIYKNKNTDKNTAIGNIFKNNAVRCEKPDMKEPEAPRPDLDQLFDSLFETNNTELSINQNKAAPEKIEPPVVHIEDIDLSKSPVSHHDLYISSKQEHHPIISTEDSLSRFTEDSSIPSRQDLMSLSKPLVTTKKKTESKNSKSVETNATKCNETSSLSLNEHMTDSGSIQIFKADKPKDKVGISLVAKECTKLYFSDTITHKAETINEANEKVLINSEDVPEKAVVPDKPTKYNSEEKFDKDKPGPVKRRHKRHNTSLAVKAEAEHKSVIPDADICNDLAAVKYSKGLSPEAGAEMKIYAKAPVHGTQTDKSDRQTSSNSKDLCRSKSEVELEMGCPPSNRIRLQKLGIHEIRQKTKSPKEGIQTDKSNRSESYVTRVESDDDNGISDVDNRPTKESKCNGKKGSTRAFKEESEMLPSGDVDSFAAPTSRHTVHKHSPRKSDEGISTSHDYSAEAFDQESFDDAGVARQRARRKCTVGKQNVLAEHWSSESEFDGLPPRPNSADSVVASVRKKKSRKKEGHSGGRRGRHSSKNESRGSRGRVASGAVSDDSDACAGPSRAPPGPKIRARPAHHYWSSDGEDAPGPQPQHGWIVGDSHKKLVTMLAHAKGRKRNNGDKRHLMD